MVAEDTAKVLEEGTEFLEDAVELVEEKVSWLVRSNPKALMGIAGLTGLVAGGALGFLIASKKLSSRLERKYILLAEKEIEDARKYYIHKSENEFSSPQEALVQLTEGIIANEGYSSEGDPETDFVDGQEIRVVHEFDGQRLPGKIVREKLVKNIFEGRDNDAWDEAEELSSRGDDPYIIHHDEYMRLVDNSSGAVIDYDQIALTYYEGDNVLTDEREDVIPNSNDVVGDENLTRFGHGSKDVNVVYIRNDALNTDYEVIRSTGKYSKEVLGYDDPDELQHSDRRQRRNRSADE